MRTGDSDTDTDARASRSADYNAPASSRPGQVTQTACRCHASASPWISLWKTSRRGKYNVKLKWYKTVLISLRKGLFSVATIWRRSEIMLAVWKTEQYNVHWETSTVTAHSKLWCLTKRTMTASWYVKQMTLFLLVTAVPIRNTHVPTGWSSRKNVTCCRKNWSTWGNCRRGNQWTGGGVLTTYRKCWRTCWCWEMWHGFITVDQTTGWPLGVLESCLWSVRYR